MATRLRIGFRLEAQRGFGNVRGAQRLSEFATDTFLALMPTQVSYNKQPSSSFPICHELQETELLWWTPASGHLALACLCKFFDVSTSFHCTADRRGCTCAWRLRRLGCCVP